MFDRTEELLETLVPECKVRAWWLIYYARTSGIPMFILSARRSYQTNRDVNGAAKSLHLTGEAFDVAVLGHHVDEIDPEWWRQVGDFAERELGLSWGGRFLHGGKPDVNHFDIRAVARGGSS